MIKQDQDWEFAKWLALLAMLANHVALAMPSPWYEAGILIGRISMPIFALIIAYRLTANTEARAVRYLKKLLIWGLIAQPMYSLLLYDNGIGRLNALFTLAIGVCLIYLAQVVNFRLAAILAGLVIIGSPWLDGGAWMPIAQLCGWYWLTRHPDRVWPSAALMAVMAAAMNIHPEMSYLHCLVAFMAIPLAILAPAQFSSKLPRMPGVVFYSFYPTHLAVIYLANGPY